MKKIALILLLALLTVGRASADDLLYGWSVSNSQTNAFNNQAEFAEGLMTLYLWLICAEPEDGGGGLASAEFSFKSLALNNQILSFTPSGFFLNAGSTQNLLLAVGGCPNGPTVAGSWLIMSNAPSGYCITSAPNGNVVSVDCSATPTTHDMGWIGFTNAVFNGGEPCSQGDYLCTMGPVSIEETTWGKIKTIWRE